jgi:hypothetical protein
VLAALAGLSGQAQALSCPGSMVAQAGVCYEPARAGYSCNGAACMEDCASGYSPSVPGFCHYRGATTYTEKPYGNKHDSTPHKCLALYYANCRANYHMDACGICSYKGAWDTTRHSYFRAPGINPDFSKAFNQISSVSQATYGASLGAMQSGYKAAADQVQKGVDEVTLRLFKAAAKSVNDSPVGSALDTTVTLASKLDIDTLNSIKRVLVLAAGKSVLNQAEQEDVANTLIGVAKKLDLYVKENANCSFGVFGGVTGAYYAGASSTFGVIANCWRDAQNKLQFRVVSSIGGSVGLALNAAGVIGFSRSFGPVDQDLGAQIGLTSSFEPPDSLGFDGGFFWGISNGMRGAQNAKPSLHFAVAGGTGFNAVSLQGGYTFKLAEYAVTVAP